MAFSFYVFVSQTKILHMKRGMEARGCSVHWISVKSDYWFAEIQLVLYVEGKIHVLEGIAIPFIEILIYINL